MPNQLGLRTADILRGNLRRIEEFPGFLLVSDKSPETPSLTDWPRLNLILWPETLDWSSRMRFLPIIPVECIVSGNMYTEVVAVKCCSRTPIAPGAIPRALETPKHSGAESPLREVSGMPQSSKSCSGALGPRETSCSSVGWQSSYQRWKNAHNRQDQYFSPIVWSFSFFGTTKTPVASAQTVPV